MKGQREGRRWGGQGSRTHPRLVRGGAGRIMQPSPHPPPPPPTSPHLPALPRGFAPPTPLPAGDLTGVAGTACDVTVGPPGIFRVRTRKERPLAGPLGRPYEKSGFQAVSAQVVRWVRAPSRGAGCYGRSCDQWRADARGVAWWGDARPSYPGSPRRGATLSVRAAP